MANAVRFSRISGDSSRFLDDSLQIPVPISLQFQDDPPPPKKNILRDSTQFLDDSWQFPKESRRIPPESPPTPKRISNTFQVIQDSFFSSTPRDSQSFSKILKDSQRFSEILGTRLQFHWNSIGEDSEIAGRSAGFRLASWDSCVGFFSIP